MKAQPVLSLLACVALAACSAQPAVIEVSPSAATTRFKGVPFRIKTEQSMAVWRLKDDGRYEQVSVAKQTLADYQRLYAIDVTSYPFASPSLHIAANPDNTLKSMQVAGTNQSAAAIDALSGTVAGISKAQSDKTTAKVAGAKAAQEADKIVKEATEALAKLPADTSDTIRQAYQAHLDAAIRQANEAWAAIGGR